MTHKFSQLVWLGANTASEPTDVLNSAARTTLFEARETACKALQQKFSQQNINVIQAVLTARNIATNFIEYNLAEFSAIEAATGLKSLYPGLKAVNNEQLTGTAITDAIDALTLTDNNNLLIVDIVDSNLELLKAMEQQLSLFSCIYVQTANEALYNNSATTAEVTEFLQAHGYIAQQTISSDPDLPWLRFSINPLWTALQQTQQEIAVSKKELQKQESLINEIKTALAAAHQAKQDAEQQLASSKQLIEQAKKDQADLLNTLEDKLAEQKREVEKNAAQEKEKISQHYKTELEKLKSAKETEKKYGGDAQIDDFLADISPFFYGKFITYVDIGAYTGEVLSKIVVSKKMSIREAHLYEPNPTSFEKLKDNLAEIKINSIHLNNFALGETEKISNFITANAMTRIMNDTEGENTTGIFPSEIKTLDSQIKKVTERHIHLLKIDVEGYEMEVLAGAKETLKAANIDIIYIEVGFNKAGTQQTYMGKIDSFLQDLGYRVFKIYEQRNEWIEDSPLLRRCNFAYMSESFSKSNPYKLTKTIAELKTELKQLQQQKN